MKHIVNRDELEDFLTILDEFEGIEGHQYSSVEMMNAAANFLSITKGSVADKKTSDRSWSDERRIVDTYTMMTHTM